MGRPKKSEPRYHQLNLSLTARELAEIERRAAALGMRPVHFGRAALFGANQHCFRKAASPKTQLHGLLYGQLARIGNNLNQLMRHLHRTGRALPPTLEPLLADIRQLLAQYRDDDR